MTLLEYNNSSSIRKTSGNKYPSDTLAPLKNLKVDIPSRKKRSMLVLRPKYFIDKIDVRSMR